MKTLKNLPVPQDTDLTKFPEGQIKNETETEQGTPVVREIYGDLLVNVYAILKDAGITPNQQEDSEVNGYQLLQALKKLTNSLNDIEQVISLSGTNWDIPLNIDKLPNKYVLFARMADAYDPAVNYTVSGTGNNSFTLSSPTGFKASDEVVMVLDQSGVRVYAISAISGTSTSGVFPVFGNPLSYNDNDTLYYEADGHIFSDQPFTKSLQQQIRLTTGNTTLYVNEIFVIQNKVLCVAFDTANDDYRIFEFPLSDLDSPVEVTVSGKTLAPGANKNPYFYTDGTYVYITNDSGNSDNDYELDKYVYADSELAFVQTNNLDQSFTKSTNVVIQNENPIVFVDGILSRYSGGNRTVLGQFNGVAGIIFNYKNEIYYTNGEVAKKWTV